MALRTILEICWFIYWILLGWDMTHPTATRKLKSVECIGGGIAWGILTILGLAFWFSNVFIWIQPYWYFALGLFTLSLMFLAYDLRMPSEIPKYDPRFSKTQNRVRVCGAIVAAKLVIFRTFHWQVTLCGK